MRESVTYIDESKRPQTKNPTDILGWVVWAYINLVCLMQVQFFNLSNVKFLM